MANLYKELPSGENSPEDINVVVEIPKGSPNKYEYNEEKGYFALDRTLYSTVRFPFDYGFIPQTLSEDGDPMDVVLITTNSSFPGCVVSARPIGVMLMEDEAGGDNKIIAAPAENLDPRFKEIKTISDIPSHLQKEFQEFFEIYKRLEPNKFVKITGWEEADKAKELINKSIERYNGNEN